MKGKEKELLKELMRMISRRGGDVTEDYLEKFRSSNNSNDVS